MDKAHSATFTISTETPQELARLLRRIADALDTPGETAREKHEPPTSPAGGTRQPGSPEWPMPRWTSGVELDWWRDWGRDYLVRLTPAARRALLFVAERGPRVPVADVAAELGVEAGPQLAGTLASIGYASRHFQAPEPPLRRVRSNYEIDPQLAELLQAISASEEQSGSPWSAFMKQVDSGSSGRRDEDRAVEPDPVGTGQDWTVRRG